MHSEVGFGHEVCSLYPLARQVTEFVLRYVTTPTAPQSSRHQTRLGAWMHNQGLDAE